MTIVVDPPVDETVQPGPVPAAPRRRRAIGIVVGSVVLAAGLFGGGIATGAALGGTASTSQDQSGQTGQGGPGGTGGQPPTGQTGTTDGITTDGTTGGTTGGTTSGT